MKCRHTEPDDPPEFLCRGCHPELTPTPAQRAKAIAAERKRLDVQMEQERRERELHRAEMKLAGLVKNREPDPASVSGKIAASLRKKVARLQAEAGGAWNSQ